MAHSKQARKRIRQTEKSRQRNRARMTTLKTAMKTFFAAVKAGDKQKAGALVAKTCAVIDKVAKANTIHQNKAARHKSQIMRAASAMA
jgi:small subunit ribosomal protein S20